jgi:hypothetical protein
VSILQQNQINMNKEEIHLKLYNQVLQLIKFLKSNGLWDRFYK